MRTTQELHIALDILMQKVSSNWNKDFLPQEKDWFINNEITKFIKQRLNPLSNDKQQGIYDTLKRVQDLNCLLETAIIEGVQYNKYVYCPFPVNYLFYISSNGYVTCSSNIITKTKKVYRFKPFSVLNTTGLRIQIGYKPEGQSGTQFIEVFNLDDLPTDYIPQDNIPSYKKNFILNNAVLSITTQNLNILVNKVGNDLFLKEDKLYQDYTISFNKELGVFEITGPRIESIFVLRNEFSYVTTLVAETYNINTLDIGSDKENEVRIIDEEVKNPILNSYLSKPKDASICGLLNEIGMRLPKVSGGIISGTKLTYLRLPRKIDLLLGIDSELPDMVLDEIVSKAAETIQGVIGADTYEKFSRENMLIE